MYRVVAYRDQNDRVGQVMYEPSNFGNKISSGKINLSLNTVGTAEFTLPMTNSLYAPAEASEQLKPVKTLVKVFNTATGDVVFDGRVSKISGAFQSYHSKIIDCEDCLAYLHDSTQVYRKVQNTTIQQFLEMIIDCHNKQVEPYKQFTLGNVTITNSTDNVYRYTEETADTFDTIKDKLIDRLGGYLVWRRETNGKLYLDYLKDFGSKQPNQPIRLGTNLKSARREVDVSELITRLVPVGATIEQKDQTEKQSEESTSADAAQPKFTISGVNDGKRYLEDTNLVREFGIIEKAVEWQDVKVPSILKTKGQEYLKNQRAALESWSVEAIDISQIDSTYKPFKLGDYYPIMDNYIIPFSDNTDALMKDGSKLLQLTGMEINVVTPQSITLAIGNQNKTLSQYQLENQAAIESAQNQAEAIADLQKRYDALKHISQRTQEQEAQLKDLENRVTEMDGGGGSAGGFYEGKIIDVSQWQGSINWNQAQQSGLALAIMRVQDGASTVDTKYQRNISSAISLGINYAVYAYFRGQNLADSANEARVFYNRVQQVAQGKTQPRFYAIDIEDTYEMGGVGNYRAGIDAYMNALNSLGVPDSRIVLYVANHLFDQLHLNVGRAGSIWIPTYGPNDGAIHNEFKPKHSPLDLWQYTSAAKIPGITENTVDVSTVVSDRFKKRYLTK